MDIVKYTRDSSFQRIKAWYIDEDSVKLTPEEIQKKDRLVHLWSLRLNNKYSRHQVIQIAIRDHKVSQATAYRDYVLSQQLFGDIDATNVAAERMVLAEAYWNLYQMALKKGNDESARKALDSYKSLFDFGDTGQKIDPKKLEASVYVMGVPRKTGKIMDKMIESGMLNMNGLFTEDAEFKELDDNEEVIEEDGE
ncbi:hypothetical protein [Epilithonimonas hominis]|uniref:hypothetical protein n=1 Tax=Epilithonimonas hominis TaxID=420404 RepID=UPI0028993778|nr:hypothetical protein [Epilithonimonas hominis]